MERLSYRDGDALKSLFRREWAMLGSGYLNSRDLVLLTQVFDETCASNGIERNSPAASRLARELVDAFESGIKDKAGQPGAANRGYTWLAEQP
jgi:hypothetical protein